MALTQSAWTDSKVGTLYNSSCTVIGDGSLLDVYTLKTSTDLDPTKPWLLYVTMAATADAEAVPLEIWVGYSSSFALTGDDSTLAATDGAVFKQIYDDVVLAVDPLKYVFNMVPGLKVADVVAVANIATGNKIGVPIAPYYAFCLNGGSALTATTYTFRIVQVQA